MLMIRHIQPMIDSPRTEEISQCVQNASRLRSPTDDKSDDIITLPKDTHYASEPPLLEDIREVPMDEQVTAIPALPLQLDNLQNMFPMYLEPMMQQLYDNNAYYVHNQYDMKMPNYNHPPGLWINRVSL